MQLLCPLTAHVIRYIPDTDEVMDVVGIEVVDELPCVEPPEERERERERENHARREEEREGERGREIIIIK